MWPLAFDMAQVVGFGLGMIVFRMIMVLFREIMSSSIDRDDSTMLNAYYALQSTEL